MKKIVSFLFIATALTSCSSDDEVVISKQSRGSIEMEYNGEKLSFGEKSYNGWIASVENDTIAHFYTARIDVDDMVFHDIRLDVYLTPER
ncbi:MAG TPA: membrane lipoprotein lipid attachment site-containing protein, partial [Vicingaceae bacterium]|nr:membrane lipoprotein lipid attachment site-containing protein [Vicingaceae bacterium]